MVAWTTLLAPLLSLSAIAATDASQEGWTAIHFLYSPRQSYTKKGARLTHGSRGSAEGI